MSVCDYKKVFVIIPCYNEAGCVAQTLRSLREKIPQITIVAINDGSTDNTLQILQSLDINDLVIIDLPFNSGIGTAVQTGLLYAERNKAEYAVKFDSDGQHLAEEIPLLLESLQKNNSDLAIGSRFIEEQSDGFKSTKLRRIGIKWFYYLSKMLSGRGITDCTSGFRAYNRKALEFAAKYYPHFDYPEPEESILFLRNGFLISEVPCKMASRQAGKSSITFRKSFYFMLKVSFAMLMGGIRPAVRSK